MPRPAPRRDHFALQLGDQWQIWSMATGKLEHTPAERWTPVTCLQDLRLLKSSGVHKRLAVDARGRALFIDEAGQVCLNDIAGEAHTIAVPDGSAGCTS